MAALVQRAAAAGFRHRPAAPVVAASCLRKQRETEPRHEVVRHQLPAEVGSSRVVEVTESSSRGLTRQHGRWRDALVAGGGGSRCRRRCRACGGRDAAGGLPALSRVARGAEGRLRDRACVDRPLLATAPPAEPVRADADRLGFVGVLYVFQSATNSWLFTAGLLWEKVFGLATYVLILAFPTGRLDRPAKIIVTCGVVTVLALAV